MLLQTAVVLLASYVTMTQSEVGHVTPSPVVGITPALLRDGVLASRSDRKARDLSPTPTAKVTTPTQLTPITYTGTTLAKKITTTTFTNPPSSSSVKTSTMATTQRPPEDSTTEAISEPSTPTLKAAPASATWHSTTATAVSDVPATAVSDATTTTTAAPDVPVTAVPDAITTTAAPDVPAIAIPDAPTTTTPAAPDVTTTAVSDATTTAAPATAVPDVPVTAVRDATTTAAPAIAIPDATTTTPAAPDVTTTAVPDVTATAVPDVPATAVRDATATAVPDATTTAVPDATVTAVPDATATAVPDATATAVSDATATAVPDATATATVTGSTTIGIESPDPTTVAVPSTAATTTTPATAVGELTATATRQPSANTDLSTAEATTPMDRSDGNVTTTQANPDTSSGVTSSVRFTSVLPTTAPYQPSAPTTPGSHNESAATDIPATTQEAKVNKFLVIGVIVCMAALLVLALGLFFLTRYRAVKKKGRREPDIEEVPLNKITSESTTGKSDARNPTSSAIDQSENAAFPDESGNSGQIIGDVAILPLIGNSNANQAREGVESQSSIATPTSKQEDIYSTVAVGSDGIKSTVRLNKRAASDVQL